METPAQRYARLREACRSHGLRMTPQRVALLRVLSRARGHSTVDRLSRGVRRLLPSVSPATVYRNAQQLVRAGVIAMLDRAGAMQFDTNPDEHHHFVCDVCGVVRDVYLDRVSYRLNARRSPLTDSIVHGCEIQLRGRCARCQTTA